MKWMSWVNKWLDSLSMYAILITAAERTINNVHVV
jgi:hypothetical protein